MKNLQGKSIKEQLLYTHNEIISAVEHGECFYEKNELDDFINSLDLLRVLAIKHFEENTEEDF